MDFFFFPLAEVLLVRYEGFQWMQYVNISVKMYCLDGHRELFIVTLHYKYLLGNGKYLG